MLLSSILTACLRNGVTVTPPDPTRKCNLRYVLTKGDRVLTFYTNHGDDYVGHLTQHHPDTDAMTDLFMDTYYKTISSAMQYLNPTGEQVRPVRSAVSVNPANVSNDVQVSKNEEKGGIEIVFPEKPTDDSSHHSMIVISDGPGSTIFGGRNTTMPIIGGLLKLLSRNLFPLDK